MHKSNLLLDRIDTLQARITNGEQVQVDVGTGEGALAQNWIELWLEVLRRWRERAKSGDWFTVSTELGPPPYSILDLEGRELSDRCEHSLVMKHLTHQAWRRGERSQPDAVHKSQSVALRVAIEALGATTARETPSLLML